MQSINILLTSHAPACRASASARRGLTRLALQHLQRMLTAVMTCGTWTLPLHPSSLCRLAGALQLQRKFKLEGEEY